MKKNLAEMTLAELWELFPIFLSEHNTYWSTWYTDEGFAKKVYHLHLLFRGDNDKHKY